MSPGKPPAPVATVPAEGLRIESTSGLAVELCANGALRRMDFRGMLVNLFLGTEVEGGAASLHLRWLGEGGIRSLPLLGPRSPAAVRLDARGLVTAGEWEGVRFRVVMRLAAAAPAWFWHVRLENGADAERHLDLVHAQDLGLTDYAAARLNEYYVSQYVDHTPLRHPQRGVVLAARQNLPAGGRHPLALIGCLERGVGFATDALQLHGLESRAGLAPAGLAAASLPSRRRQHEHSMAVLQDAPLRLAPGARAERGFFGWIEEHHPAATSEADLAFVDRALALPEATPAGEGDAPDAAARPAPSLFASAPLLAALDLPEARVTALFGEERREAERDEAGRLLSFFRGADRHVALRAKERSVLRPHGQILRSGKGLEPDEASLTSTVWMGGVFHSMLTQGHVSINRLLSTTHGYLGLFRSHGQRVFAEIGGAWQLLDLPSAFEMGPSGCRWIYEHAAGCIEARSWASLERHELWLSLQVLAGPPLRFLLSHHVAVDGDDGTGAMRVLQERDERGIAIRPRPDSYLGRRFPDGRFRLDAAAGTAFERVGGDELLFADGRSRGQPFVVLVTAPSRSAALRITGELVEGGAAAEPAPEPTWRARADAARAERFWNAMTGSLSLRTPEAAAQAGDLARLRELLPWLAHDALVHYLAPRGLEQYSGGGWGTRDVSQGPVELLLSLGRCEPVRDLLRRAFRQQNPDGDWPQWFMFFERERGIRPGDSHGDIVFWPLLALARYLLASGDATLLDETLPFFHPDGDARAEHASLSGHVDRALGVIGRRVIPGTMLAAYGRGDWNDSLQPADPALGERLCSAWTVTLHHHTFASLARALRAVGRGGEALRLEAALPRIRDDFQRLLVADGVLAGFALFPAGALAGGSREERVERLLHPSDAATGIRFRLLPMIHAILHDLFTPEQAAHHVALIRKHLLGADGARLFDRPPRYRGGLQQHFQRAESSSFFGREIGLMYTHAHLRFAEAMAHWGDPDAFFHALRQANPVGLRDVVASARPRQANCYHSSSDADFADRYEAAERYGAVRSGEVAFEGGWRVYSSGAGIMARLIRECLLGLRLEASHLAIDPVLPRALDGLRARLDVGGREIEVVYRVGEQGCGPCSLRLDGADLPFEREENPYRPGAARVPRSALRARDGSATLQVEIG